ncbi:MAG: hypothetical protein HKP12_14485 [Gammaproteobacteria bacterium]|nr:hypothetical protein [Gammaproteobacteria bacterium]
MVEELEQFIRQHPRLLVLTGVGISTDSGIPDYRDEKGAWKLQQPMIYAEFCGSHYARQRSWARSALGWPRFASGGNVGGREAAVEPTRTYSRRFPQEETRVGGSIARR